MWYLLPLLLSPALATYEPSAPSRATRTTPEERWMDARVNHMMAYNTDTYPMRFFYNQLNTTGEHIVIVVGGDWEVTEDWAAGGLAHDIAANIGGHLFYTEHRFYGQSRPADNTSLSNLRFLTVDQTLGDLAQFIAHIKSDNFENGRYNASKVVLVGCDVGGSLATWTRRVHPHLVQAVVADSAPIYAREELPEYLDVLLELLRVVGGSACANSVTSALGELRTALTTPAGLGQITQLFNTCSPFAAATPLDVATLWLGVVEPIIALEADLSGVPAACNALSGSGTALSRLAAWVRSLRPGDACVAAQYSDLVASLEDTRYNVTTTHSRLWLYQACNALGWLPTMQEVPAQFYHQLCTDVFSNHLNRSGLLSGIARTNLLYGGALPPDYVVSVRGELSPRAAAAAATHATDKAPVYVARTAPRCEALSSLADSSTDDIRQLKTQILNDVQYFVLGTAFSTANKAVTSIVMVLGVVFAIL